MTQLGPLGILADLTNYALKSKSKSKKNNLERNSRLDGRTSTLCVPTPVDRMKQASLDDEKDDDVTFMMITMMLMTMILLMTMMIIMTMMMMIKSYDDDNDDDDGR